LSIANTNGPLIAIPQKSQIGTFTPVDTPGIFFAEPGWKDLILRGPVGIFGCQTPGVPLGLGALAAGDTGRGDRRAEFGIVGAPGAFHGGMGSVDDGGAPMDI